MLCLSNNRSGWHCALVVVCGSGTLPHAVAADFRFNRLPTAVALHLAPCASSYWIAKPKLRGPDPPLFYATGEDDLAVIAQHYDVPVLSVRWAGAEAAS